MGINNLQALIIRHLKAWHLTIKSPGPRLSKVSSPRSSRCTTALRWPPQLRTHRTQDEKDMLDEKSLKLKAMLLLVYKRYWKECNHIQPYDYIISIQLHNNMFRICTIIHPTFVINLRLTSLLGSTLHLGASFFGTWSLQRYILERLISVLSSWPKKTT